MKVRIKLFATLRQGRGKVLDHDLPNATIVKDLTQALEIDRTDIAILLINGRDASLETALKEGDVVSIFPPVGGG